MSSRYWMGEGVPIPPESVPGHSETLPRVLLGRGGESSISMERALRQVKNLLERVEPDDDAHEDRLNASIDDVDMMLRSIAR